jgi:pyruvate dehydrogenase E2 component (dihydrolipoamide acetyltransferase)
MATPVNMPRQGQSVESCIIGKWHKKQGTLSLSGDTLFTYETDKATFDENRKRFRTLCWLSFFRRVTTSPAC